MKSTASGQLLSHSRRPTSARARKLAIMSAPSSDSLLEAVELPARPRRGSSQITFRSEMPATRGSQTSYRRHGSRAFVSVRE